MRTEKSYKIRVAVFSVLLLLMFAAVLYRFYQLQIIDGELYREQFRENVTREQRIPGSRGMIYDRNGVELAYNEISYRVEITDNTAYDGREARNNALNSIIAQAVGLIEETGGEVNSYLPIRYAASGGYEYAVEGNALTRFLADVYGHADVASLAFNERLGYHEGSATADQVVGYLCSDARYGVTEEYTGEQMLTIAAIRYEMGKSGYRRYQPVMLAEGVGAETMAAVMENQAFMPGVTVHAQASRRYNESVYAAQLLGYTGAISEDELTRFDAQGISYDLNDTVGKTGIEQAMEEQLRGRDGKTTFRVDNVGRVTEVLSTEEASAGNDIYLTIDIELTKTIYHLLEQKLAGILLANLIPVREENSSDLAITTNDVAGAVLENHVVDNLGFATAAEGSVQRQLHAAMEGELTWLEEQFDELLLAPYNTLEGRQLVMADFILQFLSAEGMTADPEVESRLYGGELSLDAFMQEGIRMGWLKAPVQEEEERYSEMDEELATIKRWLLQTLPSSPEFQLSLYLQMLEAGIIRPEQVGMVLFEQGVLTDEGGEFSALADGSTPAYDFFRAKIRSLALTPAMLALNPSTASSVVVDPNNGEVLACVTYPGYDNNRLANAVDADYYNRLLQDRSLPLYNNATQQRSAPGSTFKPVMVAAALSAGVIAEDTVIEDHGIFEEITPSPRCWIYPGGSHGAITVREAIRDSCNYFFYRIGYDFSLEDEVYEPEKGIEALNSYTSMFGFDETTGIELAESTPQIADEFPVTAAIGQSNHNFTTTQLARYATVLANQGSLYKLTLIKQTSNSLSGELTLNQPVLSRTLDEISPAAWPVISDGMRMMAENNAELSALPLAVAGKTGTAQHNRNQPNHALFIGYAPYQQPQIAVATRIAYGYSSSNAVEVTSDIFKYYFGTEPIENLVTGQASVSRNRGNVIAD